MHFLLSWSCDDRTRSLRVDGSLPRRHFPGCPWGSCIPARKGLRRGEQRLHRTAGDYERVVLWMEHDSWDQLVLVPLLAHYANGKRPRVLELIAADEFPGSQRYIGLGQLPSEALRLLWPSSQTGDARTAQCVERSRFRRPAAPRHHRSLWHAGPAHHGFRLASPSTRAAFGGERAETHAASGAANSFRRRYLHVKSCVALAPDRTRAAALDRRPRPASIEQMHKASEPVFSRIPAASGQSSFLQQLSITDVGPAVLRGERDWHSLRPPSRWVGGVHIQPGVAGRRWDDAKHDAVFQQ